MVQTGMAIETQDMAARKRLMALCAKASIEELDSFVNVHAAGLAIAAVRGPETGLVMVRGRIGGGGAPFNLGEATMSRASVRLESGEVGHGQCLGTDRHKARQAAIIDALAQSGRCNDAVVLWADAVEARIAAEDAKADAEIAATRVDFFTMVRGDD